MKSIIFIRHCESVHNYRIRNNLDVDDDSLRDCGITEVGIQQAAKLNFHFDILFISPMKRCLETLANSNITADEIVVDDRLREYPEHICDYRPGEPIVPEDMEHFKQRVAEVRDLLWKRDERSIGVLSHGAFISEFMSNEYASVHLWNGEYMRIRFK